MRVLFARLIGDERAANRREHALVISLIALVVVAGVFVYGEMLAAVFNYLTSFVRDMM